MCELTILIPSRGRPVQAAELAAVLAKSHVSRPVFIVDFDDSTLRDYQREFLALDAELIIQQQRRRLGECLNYWSQTVSTHMVGFCGDDHYPTSPDWDKRIVEALKDLGTGIAYGNDLIQGQALPTAVFMTTNIVKELTYMVPPNLVHLWVDNAWAAWGSGAGCLRYLPDVIIEHRHPIAGRADPDETYAQAWSHEDADAQAWQDYQNLGQLNTDIEKIKSLATQTV